MEGMTNNEASSNTKSSDSEVVIGKPPVRPKTTTSVLKEITKDQNKNSNRDNLTDKSVSTNRSKSSTKKRGSKGEWDRYFAFINDKDREKLMQIPDIPKQSRKASKSASVKRSRSMNNVGESRDDHVDQETRGEKRSSTVKRNSEAVSKKKLSFEDEHRQRSKRNNSSEGDEFKNNCEFKTAEFKSLHESKSKPEMCGKLHNHKTVSILRKSADDAADVNASDDAHFNTAYKNLVRSLRANL